MERPWSRRPTAVQPGFGYAATPPTAPYSGRAPHRRGNGPCGDRGAGLRPPHPAATTQLTTRGSRSRCSSSKAPEDCAVPIGCRATIATPLWAPPPTWVEDTPFERRQRQPGEFGRLGLLQTDDVVTDAVEESLDGRQPRPQRVEVPRPGP